MNPARPYSYDEHKRWIALGNAISRARGHCRSVVARAAGITEGRLVSIELPVVATDFPTDAELRAIAGALGVDPQTWLDEAACIRAQYGSADA